MTSYRQSSGRGLAKRSALRSNLRIIRRRWQMYVMFLVPFLWVLVFNYVPKIKAILTKYGVKKLTELQESQYEAVKNEVAAL